MHFLTESELREAVERLREAESMLGNSFTPSPAHLFARRRLWLNRTRDLLTRFQIKPENTRGPWHTEGGS